MRPVAIALMLYLIGWSATAAAGPAPPAESARRAELRRWFADLANRDPDARYAARVKLMGMKRAELTDFRDLVAQSRPLRPAQLAALREIVTQVYLAGDEYAQTDSPFIGIKMTAVVLDEPTPDRGDPDDPSRQRTGVVIADRIPGFGGYRMFLDGDVIISIAQPAAVLVQAAEDVSRVVGQYRVGQNVTFLVLRHGQAVRVTVTLDARPLSWVQIEEFQAMRLEKADAYWDRAFAPLLGEKMS